MPAAASLCGHDDVPVIPAERQRKRESTRNLQHVVGFPLSLRYAGMTTTAVLEHGAGNG
jgi:hypothetical protein